MARRIKAKITDGCCPLHHQDLHVQNGVCLKRAKGRIDFIRGTRPPKILFCRFTEELSSNKVKLPDLNDVYTHDSHYCFND